MPSTLATRMSAPLAPLDAPANAITDVMNRAVPWLWWPLAVPRADRPMPSAAHALYGVHAVVLYAGARAARLRLRPRGAAGLAALGWLWFTGAWDRRALTAPPARSSGPEPGPEPADRSPARGR